MRHLSPVLAILALCVVTATAVADVVQTVNLAVPARPFVMPYGQQNIVSVENPTASPLTFSIPAADFHLLVPAGESRKLMLDEDVIGAGRVVSYAVKGNKLAAAPATGLRRGRNLASVRTLCGESKLVTIEEPCPLEPPVSVFFLGELPPEPPPIKPPKPVRGYW